MNAVSDELVTLRDVRFRYPGASAWALNGVDFNLRRGEWVLLTGPTGCGKSTLLHCLQGLIPGELPGELHGEIVWNEGHDDLDSAKPHSHRTAYHAGLVFQNFEDQIIADTVVAEIAFGLEFLNLPSGEREIRVNEALELAGLTQVSKHPISSLSGGQRQRLVAASILAMRPSLLLLDEPLSQMDDMAVEGFLTLIDRVRRDRLMTVVMVEHRLEHTAKFATRHVKMRDGGVVSTDEELPVVLQTERLIPQNDLVRRSHEDTALSISNLSYTYGDKAILAELNCSFGANEMVALLGANGSGKSTLLHLLAGLLKPAIGDILWRGNPLQRALDQHPRLAGLMLQNPDLMLLESTVREELGMKDYSEEIKKIAKAMLPDLESLLDRPPLALSRGQRLIVALLSVLSRSPEILLLDEPSTGQDWEAIVRMMRELRRASRLTIFTTHERRVAEEFADRILWLEDGRLTEMPVNRPSRAVN